MAVAASRGRVTPERARKQAPGDGVGASRRQAHQPCAERGRVGAVHAEPPGGRGEQRRQRTLGGDGEVELAADRRQQPMAQLSLVGLVRQISQRVAERAVAGVGKVAQYQVGFDPQQRHRRR